MRTACRCTVALVALLILSAGPARAALDVPLTLTERAGVDRVDEPVVSGVPLPEGLMADTSRLTLIGPDGKTVPAQFDVATRWYDAHPGADNAKASAKWVLVSFLASVKANDKAVYRLTDGGGNVAPAQPVQVAMADGVATVTTGALKFVVKRQGFNLIDGAWIDPAGAGNYSQEILAPGKADIRLFHGGNGLPAYKSFSPAADPDVTMELEESGPVRAVIKLTGKNVSTDEMEGGNHLLDFVCRITAFAGSGQVRIAWSLECKQGKSIAEGVPLDRFWFVLPLNLDAGKTTWAVGVGDGKSLGPDSKADEFPAWNDDWEKPEQTVTKYWQAGLADCCVQSLDSKRIVYRGEFFRKRQELVVHGKEEKAKALTATWLDLGDGQKGVAAGIRWFWQTYPRAIKVGGTTLTVMLQANMASKPPLLERPHSVRAHYYPGMSKTSEVLLDFHGPRDLARLTGAQAGLQSPLRAWAPPSWYCEKTQAFGRLASSTRELYDDAAWAKVAAYDTNLRTTLGRIIKHRDLEWGDYDSYGMFNFGDTIDFIRDQRGDPDDYNVTWDNGYYDYPHALFLQWARTGDPDYFDLAEQAEQHIGDLDMMCWSPDAHMVGASRYCDGTMHIRQNGGIYQSPTFNHYKNGSHFERFYLTGARRAKDVGLVSARFALDPANNGAIGFGEPRSLGHGPLALLYAWQATGEQKYLDRFTWFEKWYMDKLDKGARIAKGRHWQGGIGMEGMREYVEKTGDPAGLEHLKLQVDHCLSLGDYAESTLQAFAFIGAQTDDAKYGAKAFDRIGKVGDIKRDWGLGQSFGNELRNAPYVFWYLTKDLPRKVKVGS
ncbi:MAG: hypothetical protein BIFFINMI_03335 [Phycisphaerae bacterium]|nr:hypothetical protein [Phycisphaerae bacterium]